MYEAILFVYVLSLVKRSLRDGGVGDIACKREPFFDHSLAGYLAYPGSHI